jgi:hypothetical protein
VCLNLANRCPNFQDFLYLPSCNNLLGLQVLKPGSSCRADPITTPLDAAFSCGVNPSLDNCAGTFFGVLSNFGIPITVYTQAESCVVRTSPPAPPPAPPSPPLPPPSPPLPPSPPSPPRLPACDFSQCDNSGECGVCLMATSSCPSLSTTLSRCTTSGQYVGLTPGVKCLAATDGACGVDTSLNNCNFVQDVYEVLNCEVIYPPSPPPSPPAPPFLPPSPSPPPLMCGVDECDNNGACGICLKLVTFLECAEYIAAVPDFCPANADAAAALEPGSDCKGMSTNCGVVPSSDNCPPGPLEIALSLTSGNPAASQAIYTIVDCVVPTA